MTRDEKKSTMHEYINNTVNRCRPGYGASCALCCGSHNYVGSPEKIGGLFHERAKKKGGTPFESPENSSEEKLFHDAMQCPHGGLDRVDTDEIGCLIYAEHDRGAKAETFFQGTCKNFYCAAWDCLTDEEVIFAARLMGDWYYYGLFINDIACVQELFAVHGRAENVPAEELESLKEELKQRLIDEDGK